MYENDCSAVSIIKDNINYYGTVVTTMKGKSVADMEFYAIIQALEYVRKMNIAAHELTVYSDVLQFQKDYTKLKRGEIFYTRYDWNRIFELLGETPTNFNYFKAHRDGSNPNKTCDILARMNSKLGDRGLL